ncbi:MAG TPA: hypothetical protein VGF08_10365 [Terriglobales bacterium]|jgi:hypothetical protein
MNLCRLCWIALVSLLFTAWVYADDQQKAVKELRKITAMASDVNARAIVSRTMADFLSLKRDQLVRERRAMNLNYGSVFLAHQLTAKGAEMMQIALGLQAKKTLLQMAGDQRVDWKQVLASAKKLNGKIEDNIYKHFLHAQVDRDRDAIEKYDAERDWVNSDADATQPEILEAQETYVLWRTRAGQTSGKGTSNVSSSEALASRRIEERTHEVRIPAPAPSPH